MTGIDQQLVADMIARGNASAAEQVRGESEAPLERQPTTEFMPPTRIDSGARPSAPEPVVPHVPSTSPWDSRTGQPVAPAMPPEPSVSPSEGDDDQG